MTKLEQMVRGNLHKILNGTMLVIDPSSGSAKSMPGYATYKVTKLQDWGNIAIPLGLKLNRRLFYLGNSIRQQFTPPDVLVVENIPPMMGKNAFSSLSTLSLHKSIGVTISCFDCPLIEVAPVSWHKWCPKNYRKTDSNDALMMGFTVLRLAMVLTGQKAPSFEDLGIDAKVLVEESR